MVAGAHAQSDDGSAPQPIAGSGAFSFNLEGLAPSQGVPNGCFQHQTPIRDGWYCWTADCTGTVTISTCGDPLVDTALALYGADNGCACPGDIPPICCGDDVCGKQARIECTVECGRRYLIRIGVKPSPVFTGTLLIECNGKPCGGSNEPVGCDCCGRRPPPVDSLPTPFDPGLVAASTKHDAFSGSPALYLVDLGGQGSAPAGSNWNTDRYSHPSWTMQNLGGIFGVTLDGVGNVYVAHTSAYPDCTATGDPVGFAGPGAIYRIDGTTGAATSVIALPQQVDPAQQVGQRYAGIGQLTWGCATRRLYASNMEDGRIYSIDPADVSGFKVKSTYRHGGAVTGALADGSLADPGDAPGFEPLGRRIRAVNAAGNRLYYSIWSRDQARQSGLPNQVWSVGLDGAGDFVPTSQQLEFDVPFRTGTNYSNPVADITFDSNCRMLVAERSMFNDTNTGSHDARVMRFCRDADGAWTKDIQFVIGIGGFLTEENATGGVGYETGGADRVRAMADAISFPLPTDVPPYSAPMVYGLVGQDSTGQPMSASLWVDLDGSFADNQKFELGSLEVNRVEANPCEFNTADIDCVPSADGTMDFLWTLDLVNNSAVPANLLILADPAFAPGNVIVLDPPLAPGGSMTLNIPINGGLPGDIFCFATTLASSGSQECRSTEVCITLPDCSCLDTDAVTTDLPGAGGFEVNLSGFTNLTGISHPPLGFPGEWVSIAVAPGYAATVTPTLVDLATLPVAGSVNVGPITVSSALPPGSPIILIIGLHSQSFHPCCFVEVTVTVPAQAGGSTPGDANGDGAANGADLAMVLSNWS